jgi:mono/diheme cytochrome c family protein
MTMTKTVLPTLPCLLLLYSIPATADPERGRLLYENHCRACHESSVHIREVQAAKSPEAVRAQVLRWQDELRLHWGAEEVGDVAEYLNVAWYHYAQ